MQDPGGSTKMPIENPDSCAMCRYRISPSNVAGGVMFVCAYGTNPTASGVSVAITYYYCTMYSIRIPVFTRYSGVGKTTKASYEEVHVLLYQVYFYMAFLHTQNSSIYISTPIIKILLCC